MLGSAFGQTVEIPVQANREQITLYEDKDESPSFYALLTSITRR